ncbi:MAG TPA: Na/Pi symporter, partial [Anaerolineae bacterium]|nr:Na/Pi symporter [Anaerolineae bacterium]
EFAKVLFYVYCFLVSINLMGSAFKLSGEGFAETLLRTTSNPFSGLFIGLFVTSIIQSSSTTTSIIVAIVGSGTLSIKNAIPMIMGANIGTTVTNTIISFGCLNRKTDFERAFCAGIVHDMFNIYATIILFPLELYTGLLYRSALFMEKIFEGIGGFKFVSPLKIIVNPISEPVATFIDNYVILLIVSLVCLFFSLSGIVKNMKGIVMQKVERVLNQYLFRNAFISLLFGMFFTALVQSSSITTSIIIPLVGAGLLTIEQIFPYTLGANLGTTITAILAALTLGEGAGMAIALAHLLFNMFGISIIYPIKKLPILTAKKIAGYVSKSKKHFFIFIFIYILIHFAPVILTFLN